MLQPKFVNSLSHPLISQMYIKQEIGHETGAAAKTQNVLVIETRVRQSASGDETRQGVLWNKFLSDLDLITAQAAAQQNEGEAFDRVDIRYH